MDASEFPGAPTHCHGGDDAGFELDLTGDLSSSLARDRPWEPAKEQRGGLADSG